ncbi:MAG: LysR family transcriptional regulator [Pseudomonadota bacterium]
MKDVDWEALRLFLVIADTGSLAAAANATGISAPTLGRQMAALEKSLGRKIFIRHQRGYELAADGKELREQVRKMQLIADDVNAWRGGAYQLPNVTISAGTWFSRFLAQNLNALWTPDDDFRLCFASSEVRLDLEHREADIGLRNARPQSGNLAVRRGATVTFAPYCATGFDFEKHNNWVSLGREHAMAPSGQWVHLQPELWISTWVSAPHMLLEAIRAGAGQGVLPCFVGDADPQLKRSGNLIPELEHVMWIVMHDDERHRPEKREVIERLVKLLGANMPLFSGETAGMRSRVALI